MDPDEKARENRLRRMAERQGYGLIVPGACLPLADPRILSCIRSFAKGGSDR
jgi:hypothetical protein